jgi:hypothetical protein
MAEKLGLLKLDFNILVEKDTWRNGVCGFKKNILQNIIHM